MRMSPVIHFEMPAKDRKRVVDFYTKVLGGQKPGVPDDIPGIGLYVSFLDTEGNRVGILQPAS